MVDLKVTQEFGRGLYASKDIEPFSHIETAELLILSAEDTKALSLTGLQFYTFKYNETQDCLALGNAEMFNHSERPNVLYSIGYLEGRPVMIFASTRPIKAGEQLFIDYTADTKVDVSEYIDKNLLPTKVLSE